MNINIVQFIPFFIITLIFEILFSRYFHKQWFDFKDTLSSLSMGIGNVISGFFTKLIVFGSYTFVYQYRLMDIPWNWQTWILILLLEDFTYYWFHRCSHEIRYFWASHVVHHSSEHYNLGTALRQTWTGNASGAFVFWLWLPLLGFDPKMIMTQQVISLVYQYWIHTEAIKRLPFGLEYILNTPSHHRVHHGSDLAYLDKNHGGILIIWDRIFGTFAAETFHPHYGLTKNIETNNPFKIAFHEWIAMGKDFFKSPSWKNKWMYVFGPPGWSHDGTTKTTAQMREDRNY